MLKCNVLVETEQRILRIKLLEKLMLSLEKKTEQPQETEQEEMWVSKSLFHTHIYPQPILLRVEGFLCGVQAIADGFLQPIAQETRTWTFKPQKSHTQKNSQKLATVCFWLKKKSSNPFAWKNPENLSRLFALTWWYRMPLRVGAMTFFCTNSSTSSRLLDELHCSSETAPVNRG